MCARILDHQSLANSGRVSRIFEAGFAMLLSGYTKGLDAVLRHQRATLLVFFGTVGFTIFLYVIIPKGFFPQQDTGVIYGTTEAAQDISFVEMTKRELAVTNLLSGIQTSRAGPPLSAALAPAHRTLALSESA